MQQKSGEQFKMQQKRLLMLAAALGVLMLSKSSHQPRGIRNHNPGNIRKSATQWQGQTGDDGAFVTFKAPEWGIRALYRVLMTYRNSYGIVTPRQIINRWAPPSENETGSYINHVAARLGVTPDAPLELSHYPGLVKAIIHHENGVQPYDDGTIAKAIALA